MDAPGGWLRQLRFTVAPAGAAAPCAQIEQTVPVTNRPLYFLWFGAPQEFRWCNVPTTVKAEDRDWWLWHGALPCAWKGGVCYKDWSVEQFRRSYDDTPWIAIDEVGPYDEVGQKIIAAVRAHKRAHPRAAAPMVHGRPRLLARGARLRDLFVPEIYLNYGGNHLGRSTTTCGARGRSAPWTA